MNNFKIKYILLFTLGLTFFSNLFYAQQGWYILNTTVSGGIYFKDVNNGIIGNYKTSDGGVTWNNMGINSGGYEGYGCPTISFPNQNTGYEIGSDCIYKTTNFGDNWTQQFYPTGAGLRDLFFPNVNIGFASGDNFIIKTTNGGNNWIMLNTPFNGDLPSIFFTDSINGYIVGNNNNDSSVIIKTTNGGLNWNLQSYINTFNYYSIFFINENTGFIGTPHNILKTVNAGLSWWVGFSPTYNLIYALFFPNASTGYGACGTGQIIKTTNGGNNWFLQTPVTGTDLLSIFFINDSVGYASGYNVVLKTTNGGGPPIGIKPISEEIPRQFKLFQNYPNPFNPSTKIKFSILNLNSPLYERGAGEFVTLKIYDLLGSEVATLVNQKLQPGSYEIEWNGSNYSSGIYFYRIIAGDYTETKRMVLLK